MPLMQLSTLVLPAPLGPIKANSSAGASVSEMPSSTLRPPKDRRRSSISSSAIPSPLPAVLLDGAIAAALPGLRLPEIELTHVGMIAEAAGAAVEHDATVFQDVAVVDRGEGLVSVLLDQQQGQRQRAANAQQGLINVLDHDRGQAERQFVDQQQLGLADERRGNGQHLPLAARQQSRRALPQGGEAREKLVELGFALAPFGAAKTP